VFKRLKPAKLYAGRDPAKRRTYMRHYMQAKRAIQSGKASRLQRNSGGF